MSTTKRCAECRDGEHPNYDNHVVLVKILQPDSHICVKRAYLCLEHRRMYLSDGYLIRQV